MREYVEVYRDCAVRVLARMAGLPAAAGALAPVAESRAEESLSIIVGLQGALVGSLVLVMSREVAWQLAERIGGEPIDSGAGYLVRSAAMELADAIAGNAADQLRQKGIHQDHSPPTVVEGPRVFFGCVGASESYAVPLETDAGSCSLVVSLARPEEP